MEFIRTGTIGRPSEAVESVTTHNTVLASTIQTSRFKVEELTLAHPPPVLAPAPPVAYVSYETHSPPALQDTTIGVPTTASTTALATVLSKESKMEIWKRITEERKAQQEKDKNRLQLEMLRAAESTSEQASTTTPADIPPPPPSLLTPPQALKPAAPIHGNSVPPPPPPSPPTASFHQEVVEATPPTRHNTHSTSMTPPASAPPPPPKKFEVLAEAPVSRDDPRGLGGSTAADSRHLAGHVRTLSDQVATMRKYMKVRDRERACGCRSSSRRLLTVDDAGVDQARADGSRGSRTASSEVAPPPTPPPSHRRPSGLENASVARAVCVLPQRGDSAASRDARPASVASAAGAPADSTLVGLPNVLELDERARVGRPAPHQHPLRRCAHSTRPRRRAAPTSERSPGARDGPSLGQCSSRSAIRGRPGRQGGRARAGTVRSVAAVWSSV